MALEEPNKVDAIGIENDTGSIVLTIADAWDWQDEQKHLRALQAKLNAYINFVESGQIWEAYPDSKERQLVIDIIARFPLSQAGADLLERVSIACADFQVKVRSRQCDKAADNH
jgi:hypothetical protein